MHMLGVLVSTRKLSARPGKAAECSPRLVLKIHDDASWIFSQQSWLPYQSMKQQQQRLYPLWPSLCPASFFTTSERTEVRGTSTGHELRKG
ncbi:unnamed protein product [Mesocestoides corti]|uniref:Uncharacterized protein n=1 Tax=Mesocestoides corti TaxID=53468 RepID=A0A3P6GE94_MESCO|nr:unnamed protein product [Mesocestoides corti]